MAPFYLFGLHGRAGAGKDTTAELLLRLAPPSLQHPENTIVHFADPIKFILYKLTGLPVSQQQTLDQKEKTICPPIVTEWMNHVKSPTAFWLEVNSAQRMDTLQTVFATPDTHEIAALQHFVDWRTRFPEPGPTVRQALQFLGTDCFRDLVHSDYWLWCMSGTLGEFRANGAKVVVIADVRFDNEAQKVLGDHGLVVRIDRPKPLSNNANQTPAATVHASEKGVSERFISHTLHNVGTIEMLECQVDDLWLAVAPSV